MLITEVTKEQKSNVPGENHNKRTIRGILCSPNYGEIRTFSDFVENIDLKTQVIQVTGKGI